VEDGASSLVVICTLWDGVMDYKSSGVGRSWYRDGCFGFETLDNHWFGLYRNLEMRRLCLFIVLLKFMPSTGFKSVFGMTKNFLKQCLGMLIMTGILSFQFLNTGVSIQTLFERPISHMGYHLFWFVKDVSI
jgi:hypothetical protein